MQHHRVFLWTHGIECHSQNSSSEASFDIRMSCRPLSSDAGSGSSERTISRMVSGTAWPAHSVRSGVASASRYRCSRSARSSRSVLATASSTWVLALIWRPCSSQVYQVTPTPASSATSSRRSPGVRRREPGGMPKSPGLSRARRAFRNSPSSARRRSPARRRRSPRPPRPVLAVLVRSSFRTRPRPLPITKTAPVQLSGHHRHSGDDGGLELVMRREGNGGPRGGMVLGNRGPRPW